MEQKFILALDQGTTSSRAILFDSQQDAVATFQQEYPQYYPYKSWVEQDANEIWSSLIESARKLLISTKVHSDQIAAIGITNQRETTIIWDRKTGKPVYNAIVWQDTRTSSYCKRISSDKISEKINLITGLRVDSYFSATKIKWILDKVDPNRERSKKGELLFGTVDSWILWKLTKGEKHLTDYTNASRTMIFDINKQEWSGELLEYFNIPKEILPQVRTNSEIYAHTHKNIFGIEIPIASMIGDQQSALFGQKCFKSGMAKNTYGTGCFMLMNTGNSVINSTNGLLSTIAWKINNEITYALEGSVFVAGAVIQWLRDELGLIKHAKESEAYANKVVDNNGVYMVPSFTGLGAPYWDDSAEGAIVGLTRDSNKNHIIRAALESIAYQTCDVLKAMEGDSGISLKTLLVDGGAVENNLLMQFQSDILNTKLIRPKNKETTALGAALLAGLAIGFYNQNEISTNTDDDYFSPKMTPENRKTYYKGWLKAVDSVKTK
jgi:glycerol kinase